MKRAQWSVNLAVAKKRTKRTVENVELVERLAISQENAQGTHRTVRSITMFLP